MGPAQYRCGFGGERVGPTVWAWLWSGKGGANPVWDVSKGTGGGWVQHSVAMVSVERGCAKQGGCGFGGEWVGPTYCEMCQRVEKEDGSSTV